MSARAARSRHPVIIATGEKSLDQLDFQLPGPIELEWRRQYRSGDARSDGWFGQGWAHPLATELWIEDDVLRYWDEQGREVALPAIEVGQEHFETYERFTLTRPAANRWALRHNQGLTHHFRRRHAGQWRLPLEVIQDRNLRRVLLEFDANDFGEDFDPHAPSPRPWRLLDSAGRAIYLQWTDQAQLSEVVAEVGDTRILMASYRYAGGTGLVGGHFDLASHTDPNGHVRTYAWDHHLLVGYTLATGQRFSNRYDRVTPAGRVTESLALDDGTGNWFEYNGRTTRVRDRLGRETVYVHNARRDITAVHDAEGNVTRTEYDVEGRPEASTDAMGRTNVMTFDSRGNLTMTVDAAGNVTKVEYDALNLPIKLTDAMGGEWLWQRDERGNLIASIDPLGYITRYEVDASGRVTGIIDALGKRKTLQWDEAVNLVAYTDCSGYTSRQVYDAFGHPSSSTDALDQRTDYDFDALGRLRHVTEPDGARHQYIRDGEGNLIRYVGPLGQVTTWTYNGAGALLSRVDPLGHALRYHYDHGGRLATLTNENGEVTRFGYDLLDRLTDEVGFDGRHQRYTYNAASKLTHVIERGGSDFGPGKVTCLERDRLGRLTFKHHIGETAEQAASSWFAYDALDRLILASNASSETTFSYDALGQLRSERQTLQGTIGGAAFEFHHQYDALGNCIQTELPGGRKLNHLFYGSGHLHEVNLDYHVISNFERDALYREVHRSQGRLGSDFEYDHGGRLSAQRVRVNAGTEFDDARPFTPTNPESVTSRVSRRTAGKRRGLKGLIERHYRYDLTGQLVQLLDEQRGISSYRYDLAGRITQSQIGLPQDQGPPRVLTDGAGNRTPQTVGLMERFDWDRCSNPLSSKAASSEHAFVSGNRLLIWEDARYVYDEYGNLIERMQGKRGSAAQEHTRFSWDAANQLISAEVNRGSDEMAISQSFSYAYDALGRRVAKSDAFGITRFAWDGDQMTLEKRGGNETIFVYHPETFVPLAQLHDGVLNHVHTDHLGTPLEASNDSGKVTWRVTYRTWGSVVSEEVTEIKQKLRFQGQYFDDETGLHYSRFRYYDSRVGRFISEDPIGLNGGENLFQYAPNPLIWIDPFGLALSHVLFPRKQVIKQVQIKMQGSRNWDFRAANEEAGLLGCNGKPTINAHKLKHGDVTWHHADYDPVTNTATMQLVTTADHVARFPHEGSVSDFEKANGVNEYGSKASKRKAAALNKKCPCQ